MTITHVCAGLAALALFSGTKAANVSARTRPTSKTFADMTGPLASRGGRQMAPDRIRCSDACFTKAERHHES
jgi:hypothetical protein